MKPLSLLALAALATGAHAAPFPGADLAAGQKIAEQKCVSCHAQKVGGDGSKIYGRGGIKSAALLTQQLEMCDAMGHGKLTPAERNNVAGWLNSRYYHFK